MWKEAFNWIDDQFFSFPFKIFPAKESEVDMLEVPHKAAWPLEATRSTLPVLAQDEYLLEQGDTCHTLVC